MNMLISSVIYPNYEQFLKKQIFSILNWDFPQFLEEKKICIWTHFPLLEKSVLSPDSTLGSSAVL